MESSEKGCAVIDTKDLPPYVEKVNNILHHIRNLALMKKTLFAFHPVFDILLTVLLKCVLHIYCYGCFMSKLTDLCVST